MHNHSLFLEALAVVRDHIEAALGPQLFMFPGNLDLHELVFETTLVVADGPVQHATLCLGKSNASFPCTQCEVPRADVLQFYSAWLPPPSAALLAAPGPPAAAPVFVAPATPSAGKVGPPPRRRLMDRLIAQVRSVRGTSAARLAWNMSSVHAYGPGAHRRGAGQCPWRPTRRT